MDPAIEKPFAESEHAKESPNVQNLLDRISVYLDGIDRALGAEVVRLLRDLDAYLRDAVPGPNGAAHASPDICNTLKTMQASLDRIENQGKAVGNTMSYAAVAARSQASESAKRQATPDDILKEKRRAKEITIRVEDPGEAEELRKKSSKDILLTV